MNVKIVTLVENTAFNPELSPKHGLSFYVETPRHKLLFDVGPNEFFYENAKKLGIDLSEVDTVILSHGHYDHGGGLETFFAVNDHAKVYIRKSAFVPHYSQSTDFQRYIGLEKDMMENGRFLFTEDVTEIDEELFLFSAVEPSEVPSQSNSALKMEKDGQIVQDDFAHEQNLILTAGKEKILMAGCSHAGIGRIQSKAAGFIGRAPDRVIGGFHLYNPSAMKYESDQVIDETVQELLPTSSRYYTCHCTGQKAFDRMKEQLGDRLQYMGTGSVLLIGE
ncbi:MAG: MBL fold metallo-hydrolase [Clostridiales bacterium]|nr:MBL fold metallo-hydrolase [Clostridiales bacterium]